MKLYILISLFIVTSLSGKEPIEPIPLEQRDFSYKKATLGKLLFFDPILSVDNSVSCASCHDFDSGGADPRPVSVGVHNKPGNIQSPTVLNARYNFKQFWNGRSDTLLEQADGPMKHPSEMGMEPQEVEKRLNAHPLYKELFSTTYKTSKISYAQVLDAIVAFEKALITPNSKFDRYLRGEISLSEKEEEGYFLFKRVGCISCHNGINVGSNSFQKMGLIKSYDYDDSYPDRHAITKKNRHKNVFKVPTLRNIAQTAPYFHDASAKTLPEAVRTMALYNLGIRLPSEDISALVAFLNTLSGERPAILDMP